MGILNCTPDSFSDGGSYLEADAALRHALRMRDEGAEIIDIGGESSRPGAGSVPVDEELQRVLPVIHRILREAPELSISVDTRKVEVAAAALEAGAVMINDISGGRQELFSLVAEYGAAIVLMHMRGEPATMQSDTRYEDVVEEVRSFLFSRAEEALRAGISREKILLDPGIGFGKDDPANLALLCALPGLGASGFGVLVGASRKSFIGRLCAADVGNRLPGSLAALLPVLGMEGAVVRVHDVAATRQFLRMASLLGIGR